MDIRFGPFTVDPSARQLRHGSQPVHLSPKAFDLLLLLLQRRPEAVSKADIHGQLWSDTFVADINLAVLIAEIRSALGEDARHSRFVRTVHRHGYAFGGTALDVERSRDTSSNGVSYWLAWDAERAALHAGENLVGRDPSADVFIDAAGVSRRHAMIVVIDDEAIIHDLSSKNGTYVDDIRVTSSVLLIDGAAIRLGPAQLRFRRLAGGASTQTVV